MPEMHEIVRKLLDTWPLARWSTTRVLIAVSGGADSVALLRAMHSIAREHSLIEVAHYNHRWRGDDSEQDASFVRGLSESLGCNFNLGIGKPIEPQARSEDSARADRYRFLTETAYRCGARYVITAHTANDRVETLLHNLCRGTGLSGVASPLRTRPLHEQLVLVRPFITCNRSQVVDYLNQLGQDYREDQTNAELTFRRNYIRHTVLPILRMQYGESLDEKLLSFSELAEEATQVFVQLGVDYLEKAAELRRDQLASSQADADRNAVVIPRQSLLPAHWPIIREALRIVWVERGWPQQAMSRRHWNSIRDALESTSLAAAPTFQLPGKLVVRSENDWIRITES